MEQKNASDGKNTVRVLVFAASLRQESLNGRLADLAARIAASHGAVVDHARMADFDTPSFDQDLEVGEGFPPGAAALKRRLEAADGFIVASPEYNFSMPGVLKNTIDWASRYRPQPFRGKHALLMSASPSMAGGTRGLQQLRVPLEHLGVHVYPDMFGLAQAHQMFAPDGRIANPKLQDWFEGTVASFLDLVEAARHYPCMKARWVEFLGERPDGVTERVEAA